MTISAITYSQIPATSVGVNILMTSGYATVGDLGAGAIFTSVGATSGGLMAIQDAGLTWYNLVIPGGVVNPGWFGYTGLGGGGDTSALIAAQNASLMGKSVILPTLPIQNTAGTNHTFGTADFFYETRRSNSGTAMGDTFPASSVVGLTNGTTIAVDNVDATATITISAGLGTQINGGSTVPIGPGRSTRWVYDTTGSTPNWRPTQNSLNALLISNSLSEFTAAQANTALLNIGGARYPLLRSQISSSIVGASTIVLGGFTAQGDYGSGAVFTSQGATSGGPMAIQDSTGTWYQLVLGPGTGFCYNQQAYSTNSSTSASTTLIAANMYGGFEEHTLNLTGAITAASNAQLPTVSSLVSAIGASAVAGQTYRLRIINSGGASLGIWTITTNTGWTLTGNMAIGLSSWSDFYITLTSLTTATIQFVGSIASTLAGQSDVNVTEGAGINGYYLSWNNSTSKWIAVLAALSNLSDVNITESSTINGYSITWNNSTSKWVATLLTSVVGQQQYSTNSSTSASTTLAAADISGGSEEHALGLTGAITAASNAQLPTVTALVTAIGNAVIGQTYKLRVINGGGSADGIWTLTTNTGWTLNGVVTVAPGTYRDFYVTLNSLTTATLQSIGSGGTA